MLTAAHIASLREVARQAGALVAQAEERVRKGTVCDSWLLGDDAACVQLVGNVTRLKRQIGELTAAVQQGDPASWTAREVEWFTVKCDLISGEARNLAEAGDWSSWDAYAREVGADVRRAVTAGVAVTTDIVGGAAGGIAGGLLDGLGIGGIALVAIVAVLVLKARNA